MGGKACSQQAAQDLHRSLPFPDSPHSCTHTVTQKHIVFAACACKVGASIPVICFRTIAEYGYFRGILPGHRFRTATQRIRHILQKVA